MDLSSTSAAQAEEYGDRKITSDEYREAFNRYRECVRAAGFELIDLDMTGLVYEFGIPDTAAQNGTNDRCYSSEFHVVDMLWQTSDEVEKHSETAQFVKECLQHHGIEPATTMDEMAIQFTEAGIEIAECE
ncbi:hypothetical protein [Nocardioides sp.]|uniref:hypothetical protein n=1 Tax=Nocardioides sp. TaxID=35761 RepID=UPI0019B2DFCD|nr:hypothetical protein [Nocardioides sp.]MBC7277496.1 hypothetical protein [Nocardioides sp.]